MQVNTRVRSEFNTGTVVAVGEDGSVAVQWDGFACAVGGLLASSLTIESVPPSEPAPAPKGWDVVDTSTDDEDHDEEHERERRNMRSDGYEGEDEDEGDDEPAERDDMFASDMEADADVLRMSGMGTDEDYGHHGDDF